MSTQFKLGDTVERVSGSFQYSTKWENMTSGDIGVITKITKSKYSGRQVLTFHQYGPGHTSENFKLVSTTIKTKSNTPLKGSDIKIAIEAAIIQGQTNVLKKYSVMKIPEQVNEIYKTFIIDKQKSNRTV